VEDVLKNIGRLRGSGRESDEKMTAYAAARDNRFDSLVDIQDG
jgi:hypothetical protein